MALKIANTAVVDDSGNFVGEFGGLVVNNRLVFQDTRCFQGDISGYVSGGACTPPTIFTSIDRFPFSSDTNATCVGDLTAITARATGHNSETHGYVAGGSPTAGKIEKFPFADETTSIDVGELSTCRIHASGSSSLTHGYVAGGQCNTPSTPLRNIEKFSFSSDSPGTSVGNLFQPTGINNINGGHSSSTDGYTSGGESINTIQKFPFSTDSGSSDVGELLGVVERGAGQSSSTFGYKSGGFTPPFTMLTTIQKFPFSSDTSATDVGELTDGFYSGTGISSTNFGYHAGGNAWPTPGPTNNNEKFPFAADAPSSDVGELVDRRNEASGQQV